MRGLAVALESPYGNDTSDLPLESIEKGVELDLLNLARICAGMELDDFEQPAALAVLGAAADGGSCAGHAGAAKSAHSI
jgi:hypothetical protein